MYIYRQVFHTIGTADILYFCNARCRSAQNVAMMMMLLLLLMMMIIMSNRRRRGYLRAVTFEAVCKTLHFFLYSSISVHCHTVNSLFRLPDSMLKVHYKNLPACHFIGGEEQ
jgi:hypothetical protein